MNRAGWYFLCAELLVPEECVECILLSSVDLAESHFCAACERAQERDGRLEMSLKDCQ